MKTLLLVLMLALPSIASAQEGPCPQGQPAQASPVPGWVPDKTCQGWVPPTHPDARDTTQKPPVEPPAQAPAIPNNGWAYEGDSFKIRFDHDGDSVAGYYVEVNGMVIATVPVDALVERQGLVSVPGGLARGTYTVVIHTFIGNGVITASSDPVKLEIKPKTGTGKATGVTVIRIN